MEKSLLYSDWFLFFFFLTNVNGGFIDRSIMYFVLKLQDF